ERAGWVFFGGHVAASPAQGDVGGGSRLLDGRGAHGNAGTFSVVVTANYLGSAGAVGAGDAGPLGRRRLSVRVGTRVRGGDAVVEIPPSLSRLPVLTGRPFVICKGELSAG